MPANSRLTFLQSPKLWYTVLMLTLAVLHRKYNVDNISIWLGVAAAVPWILPELQGLVDTFKVGSLIDVKFRARLDAEDEKIAVQQMAIEGGVGKLGPAAVPVAAIVRTLLSGQGISNEAPEAAEEGDVQPEIGTLLASDPNKGKFGSKPLENGLRLSAEVTTFPGSDDLFVIRAAVAASDRGRNLKPGTTVTFYLHPTFPRPVVDTEVKGDGMATLDRAAWGAFTMGAIVHETGKETRLELDLAQDVAGAPRKFVSR